MMCIYEYVNTRKVAFILSVAVSAKKIGVQLFWLMQSVYVCHRRFNTLRPRQNGRHFPNNIFKCIFLNENVWISIKISLRFVPKGPINNIPALVQIMAWRRLGDKPLSEPMVVKLPTHICVTRPQWVKPTQMFICCLWYNQATSHHQTQCLPRFMSLYGVIRPQLVKFCYIALLKLGHFESCHFVQMASFLSQQ